MNKDSNLPVVQYLTTNLMPKCEVWN